MIEPPGTSSARLSADGSWWWDGTAWVPATSDDGLWNWDGERWRPAGGLTPDQPEMLAGQLDSLAQSRFAEAGRILVERRAEWTPTDPELAADVDRAAALVARIRGADAGAGRPGAALNALFSRAESRDGEREALEAELWPLSVLVGRRAPRPSLKEADELLGPARLLAERAAVLSTAAVELAGAREEHRAAVEDARARVAEAVRARDVAVQDLEMKVREREHEEAAAREELTAGLRAVRMPGPGLLVSRYDAVALYANRLDTPDGRAPVAGASAVTGTAPELWQRHRDVIGELLLFEAAHAAPFHDDLVAGEAREWMLILTRRGASLLPCPEGRAEEARRFAAELAEAEQAASASAKAREAELRAAEAALEAARGDGGAVKAARAELAAALEDPALRGPIEEAEAKLAEIEAEPAAVQRARRKLERAAAAALEPPPPLASAPTGDPS